MKARTETLHQVVRGMLYHAQLDAIPHRPPSVASSKPHMSHKEAAWADVHLDTVEERTQKIDGVAPLFRWFVPAVRHVHPIGREDRPHCAGIRCQSTTIGPQDDEKSISRKGVKII